MVVERKAQTAGSRLGRRRRTQLANALTHAALIACSAVVLLPLLYQLSTSLKEPGDVFLFPPQWIPDPIRWQNYADAITAIPFFVYLGNTVMITIMAQRIRTAKRPNVV